MKNKTIVFSCLSLLFLLSAFSGFSSGLVSGGVGCLVICVLLAFFAYRSLRSTETVNIVSPDNPQQNIVDTIPIASPLSLKETNKNAVRSAPSNKLSDSISQSVSTQEISEPVPPLTPMQETSKHATAEQYEFLDIQVAGVTFKNDKGVTRQTLLRKIKEHSAPFDKYIEISLNQYDYEGEIAYSVCVNDKQIGNVPKSQVQYLYDNIERFIEITRINVYGGYRDDNGYFKSYGANITLKLQKSDAK